MARNQKNFTLQLYVDDDTAQWNLRSEIGGAASAVDGHAAKDTSKPVWVTSFRNRPRRVIYQDSVTLRTVSPIIFTPAAFAAIAKGVILAVQVAGLATTVNYEAVQKVAEKKAGTRSSPNLADS